MTNKERIPLVDLAAQHRKISAELHRAVEDVANSNAFIRGPMVSEFEKNFAAFCEAGFCLGVGSGTDALFVALKACGIGPGDEVLVPVNTFIATSEAVTLAGAKPVFVDCRPDIYTIDPARLREKITPRTKAVIPVHLYGCPADMVEIREIADRHGLKIIQDCAQAHGATINNVPLADFGDILCFSFFPGKNLGAWGDAGAVVTNDEEKTAWMRMFANHGRQAKYDHEFEGINSRLDTLQAAILNVKLKYLKEWTEQRRQNAARYDKLLAGTEGLALPFAPTGYKHVYHLYVARTKNRDRLLGFLHERGIMAGVHYPRALHNSGAYHHQNHGPDDFTTADRLQNEIISLPMYPELDRKKISYISKTIREFLAKP